MQTEPEEGSAFTVWRGRLDALSSFLGHFRWVFMPLGLCALVAMGVHAAADGLDDRILWLLDRADGVMDAFWASFELTQPVVNWVDAEERTFAARGLTLIWELSADVVLALPLLGYAEEARPRPDRKSFLPVESRRWPALVGRLKKRPTGLRIIRPLCTAAVVVAGACALAKMVQGATYLTLYRGVVSALAGPLSRGLAITVLCSVLASFGWRALLRSFQDADELSEEEKLRGQRAWTYGIVGSTLCIPVAVAALVDASPLLSFFR